LTGDVNPGDGGGIATLFRVYKRCCLDISNPCFKVKCEVGARAASELIESAEKASLMSRSINAYSVGWNFIPVCCTYIN